MQWVKPHPILAVRFLTHHKMYVLSTGIIFAANAAYARNYMQMQHRCPQCLFEGQGRPASFAKIDALNLVGIAGASAMDYYIFRLHRADANVSMWGFTAWAAVWQARFAYDYSQVNNIADFNRMESNRMRKISDFAPYIPTRPVFVPRGR
ncbi:MAG: hypothetical protein ACREQ5_08875 [Candidatus Dormibacteria bacterium]